LTRFRQTRYEKKFNFRSSDGETNFSKILNLTEIDSFKLS